MIEKEKEAFIRLENINKTYISKGRVVEAVKNASLEIEKGTIVGIIGFSGAGKSTLVRCINLLEKPTSGSVYIDGKNLTQLKNAELRKERKRIGMIFQQFNLFASRNVHDNVAFPLKYTGLSKGDIEKRVKELLNLVGLDDYEKAYPSQLSGGQKQRVAIARALASEPDILLSDEATSALDPETTESILQLLKELNRKLNLTIVVITHEMQVVKDICDRAVVMDSGEVVEQGTVFDIFANSSKPITKKFIANTTNLSKVSALTAGKSGIAEIDEAKFIVKLQYREKTSANAVVSYLSRTFNLNINIIFGDVELIGNHPIGGLVAIFDGDTKDIRAAIEYLENINVGIEVIRNDGILE